MELDLSTESSEHGAPPEGWDSDVMWDLSDDVDGDADDGDEEVSDLEAAERASRVAGIGAAEAQELDALGEYSDAGEASIR